MQPLQRWIVLADFLTNTRSTVDTTKWNRSLDCILSNDEVTQITGSWVLEIMLPLNIKDQDEKVNEIDLEKRDFVGDRNIDLIEDSTEETTKGDIHDFAGYVDLTGRGRTIDLTENKIANRSEDLATRTISFSTTKRSQNVSFSESLVTRKTTSISTHNESAVNISESDNITDKNRIDGFVDRTNKATTELNLKKKPSNRYPQCIIVQADDSQSRISSSSCEDLKTVLEFEFQGFNVDFCVAVQYVPHVHTGKFEIQVCYSSSPTGYFSIIYFEKTIFTLDLSS